jgi:hypothetical protein
MSDTGLNPPALENTAPSLGPKDWWPVLVVVVLYAAFFCAVILRWWPFTGMSWQNRGEMGDSFNVLSALFNGLAFAGLIITIFIQSRELRLQRHQLSLQRTEPGATRRGQATCRCSGAANATERDFRVCRS